MLKAIETMKMYFSVHLHFQYIEVDEKFPSIPGTVLRENYRVVQKDKNTLTKTSHERTNYIL